MKKYLLFDLDGTLTDPKIGITTCVQYALRSFGIEEPDPDKLEPFIGPPLKDSFMEFYGFSAEQAEEAVAKYRERFKDTGIFENEVYAGIPRMLGKLQSRGMVLAVASSKPQVFVERILEHFKLQKYFSVVVGSELSGDRSSKDEVVQEALNRLFSDKPVDRDQVYMIGDRKFDVEGAKALGIESVGVTYGYGSMEELKEAKADYIVQSVTELEKFLMREADENTGTGRKLLQGSLMILGSYCLYELVRGLSVSLFQQFVLLIKPAGTDFSRNWRAIVSMIGFICGALAVSPMARPLIEKTADETFLWHLKKNPPITYLFLGLAVTGAALGLNFLLELTEITLHSNAYQQVAAEPYSSSFLAGLLLVGLVSPLAEELLFRGVVHNCIRGLAGPKAALIVSSLLFAVYHGNMAQGIYAFLMGCLIAYAYEYFGAFKMAVASHMAANILVYALTYSGKLYDGIVNWPVCLILLMVSVVSLVLMVKSKRA